MNERTWSETLITSKCSRWNSTSFSSVATATHRCGAISCGGEGDKPPPCLNTVIAFETDLICFPTLSTPLIILSWQDYRDFQKLGIWFEINDLSKYLGWWDHILQSWTIFCWCLPSNSLFINQKEHYEERTSAKTDFWKCFLSQQQTKLITAMFKLKTIFKLHLHLIWVKLENIPINLSSQGKPQLMYLSVWT